MKTLIRNAVVVLPEGCQRTSVLIDGDKIAGVDAAVHAAADEYVDAAGLHLLPGVIDDQVHFRDPGLTHKEDLGTGSRACARGGVTTFLEMPNTKPATVNRRLLEQKLALAAAKSLVNYGFYIGATPNNLHELRHADRTPGVKIFFGSSTGSLLVDRQNDLERIFAETTLPICAHCEDEAIIRRNAQLVGATDNVADHSRIRDVEAAAAATRRAINLAVRHQHRLHVLHVSTGQEAADILPAGNGYVTAEVCPHHLLLNIKDYDRLGTLAQVNPSLKTESDNRQLWQALREEQIQVIATDHAPHTLEEKRRPYPQSPSGIPSVENSLALMLNQVHAGQCTIEQVVRWMCEAPARVWDIVGKGRIAPGYDADLVLVDMNKQAVVSNRRQVTRCGWSVWHGQSLTGWPVRTWVMGQEVFRDGRLDDRRRGREAVFDHSRGGYWAER